MPVIVVQGTDAFRDLAKRMKEAGETGLRRELGKALREGVTPLVNEARERVAFLDIKGQKHPKRVKKRGKWMDAPDQSPDDEQPKGRRARSGASARQARAQFALRNRRKVSARLKTRTHKSSGLRVAVARSVSAKVSAGARSSSLRVRAEQAKMPPSQRKLPRHLNTGRWRHPTFGRSPWVTQTAEPGWFDGAMADVGPSVRDRAITIVGNYVEKLE